MCLNPLRPGDLQSLTEGSCLLVCASRQVAYSCQVLPGVRLWVREAVMRSGVEGIGQVARINLFSTCPALSSVQAKALCPWLHRHKILSQGFMCYHAVKVP